MYAIEIKTHKDGYSIIRVHDEDGIVCSYCGFGQRPFLALLDEKGIDCR
jgi:hypothetical protein